MKAKLVVGLAAFGFAASVLAQGYTIDPRHTFVTWAVSHFGISTFRGKLHKVTGKIVLDRAARSGSVDVTIDAAAQWSGDDKLDLHLAGNDFFAVAKFPAITFKSNRLEFSGDTLSRVHGDMTMLGVTRPVTLNASLFRCIDHPVRKVPMCGADFTTSIMRSEFGMKYAVPVVGDEVKLDIQVEAYKD